MKFTRFEDILAWQKAKVLAIIIYQLLRESKDFSYRDQIQRAIVSVMNNIAEGYERKSNKEFERFLYIAKGSVGEVRSMISLGIELMYFQKDEFDELDNSAIEISKMLSGLIKSIR